MRTSPSPSPARSLLAVPMTLAFVLSGCQTDLGMVPNGGGVDVGGSDEDPYWCCDPDQGACDCPSLWHCTETAAGKHCSQDHPFLPDSGEWTCRYTDSTIVCHGSSSEHPNATDNGDWHCVDQGVEVVCERPRGGDDLPDVGADGQWDCYFSPDGEMRTCDDSGAPDGDEWAGPHDRGGEGEGEGEGEGPWDDSGFGGEICNGVDDDHDGRIDEGRVCGDANEGGGACPIGAIRICDAYCGVHQTCGPDGNWGPCLVDEMCERVQECDQHSDCPRGFYCDYGMCSPGTFDFFPCEADGDCVDSWGGMGGGWTCQRDQGVCIQDCYHHSDCGAGLVCDLGQCVEDPYVPGQCV